MAGTTSISKTAALCVPGEFRNVLGRIIGNQGYTCQNYSIATFDEDFAGLQGDSTKGIFCVWADDFQKMGTDGAISWLTRLRIEKDQPWHRWPVIIIGYSSQLVFLRSLKVPRILASPGVECVQLPCELRHLCQKIERAVAPSEDVIRDYVQDHDHAKRLGDQLAHDLGNFYAMFRLLDGARLSGALSENVYKTVLEKIKRLQEGDPTFQGHLAYREFLYLREAGLKDIKPAEIPILSVPLARGNNVLLIDDAGGIGWAHVLACLLFGYTSDPDVRPYAGGVQVLRWPHLIAIGRAKPLDRSEEDSFVEHLERTHYPLWKEYLSKVDIVVLDLRLRRNEDENVPPQQCSGVAILRKIRQVNAGIPVILFTASRKSQSLDAVLQQGADYYLIKDPGDTRDAVSDLITYYRDFSRTIEDALQIVYRRDLWVHIERAEVDPDVKVFLRKAFALVRHRPSPFEKELSYTPYAPLIVALGSSIEKHVKCGPGEDFPKKAYEFYCRVSRERTLETLASSLYFLRNNASHSGDALSIEEQDARFSFILTLQALSISVTDEEIWRISGCEMAISIDAVMRRVFSYVRKVVNLRKGDMPRYQSKGDWFKLRDGICTRDLRGVYLSILCSLVVEKPSDKRALMNAALSRFRQLISPDQLEPVYDENELRKTSPRIAEAFWDQDGRNWVIPGLGEVRFTKVRWDEGQGICVWTNASGDAVTRFKPNHVSHTQSFVFHNLSNCEPWGPPIPYGEYTEDELKEMLTIKQL